MKILALIILLFTSLQVLASDQSAYSKCIRDGYYAQNNGPNSCDFSNVRANLNSVTRECNMSIIKDIDFSDMAGFKAKMDELQANAFESLNKDLNSKLYGCGYMGEIELRANGGSIQIFEFTVSPESCGMLADLVAANNVEYDSAGQERQDELREQNHLLNRIRQRSGCDEGEVSVQQDQGTIQ